MGRIVTPSQLVSIIRDKLPNKVEPNNHVFSDDIYLVKYENDYQVVFSDENKITTYEYYSNISELFDIDHIEGVNNELKKNGYHNFIELFYDKNKKQKLDLIPILTRIKELGIEDEYHDCIRGLNAIVYIESDSELEGYEVSRSRSDSYSIVKDLDDMRGYELQDKVSDYMFDSKHKYIPLKFNSEGNTFIVDLPDYKSLMDMYRLLVEL